MNDIKIFEKKVVFISLLALPALLLFLHFAALYERSIGDFLYSYAFFAAFIPGGIMALRIAKSRGFVSRQGMAFLSVAAALLSMGMGSLVWDYYAYFSLEEPFPTLAEAFYILVMPFMVIAMIYLVSIYKITIRKSYFVLPIIVSVAWFLFAYNFTEFSYTERFANGFDWVATVEFAYLISDALTIGFATFLLFIVGGKIVKTFKILTASFIFFAIANSLFFYRYWNDLYYDGDISDNMYVLSGLTMTYGVLTFYQYKQDKKLKN